VDSPLNRRLFAIVYDALKERNRAPLDFNPIAGHRNTTAPYFALKFDLYLGDYKDLTLIQQPVIWDSNSFEKGDTRLLQQRETTRMMHVLIDGIYPGISELHCD
jgi:hypothetical protein